MDFIKKPTLIGIAIAVLVTSLIGTGFYLSRKDDAKRAGPDSVRVEVDKVRRGSLTREMTVVGTLEADHFVTIKAQIRGLVSKVHIVGGENVQKGDLLFELDDRTYSAQLKEAQALLTLAESAFEREKKLSEKNFGTAKKLDEARAQFLKTQAGVEKAQKDLDDTKIRAPFDGIVGLHHISEGTPITADLDLISITDMDPMKVNFKMPSKFIPHLNVGQRIKVSVDSYPDQEFPGEIEAIDAQIDTGAQSIAIQAAIPNKKNLLKPGMFVRVKVIVGSQDNSLIVPEEAIVSVADQNYVWKVIEHPEHPGIYVVFRVQVLTGIQEKDRMEITKNLREGDIIVTVGHQKVADGVPVSFDLRSIDIAPPEEETTAAPEEKEVVKKEELPNLKADKTPSLWTKIKSFFSPKKAIESKVDAKETETEEVVPTDEEKTKSAEDAVESAQESSLKEETKTSEESSAPTEEAAEAKEVTTKEEEADKSVAPVAYKAKPRSKVRYYNKTNANFKALFSNASKK